MEHGQKQSASVQSGVRGPGGGVGSSEDVDEAGEGDEDDEQRLGSSDDDGDVRNVYISLLKCTETYSHLLNILCIPKCNFFLRIPQVEMMQWMWRQHYKVPMTSRKHY